MGLSLFKGGSLSPCPACRAKLRSSSDKRGPVGFNAELSGWRCHRCGAGGDVVDLVAWATEGARYRDLHGAPKTNVRAWFDDMGVNRVKINGVSAPPPAPRARRRPMLNEVKQLWLASGQLASLGGSKEDQLALDFLKRRHLNMEILDSTGIVRALPHRNNYQWPDWWPGKWAALWRVITPAFEPDGRLASIHARSVASQAVKPKSRWPIGYEAGGLFMGNADGIRMLRGRPPGDLEGLLVCEGLTDLFQACSFVICERMKFAVLAGASGSFRDLSKVRVPEKLDVIVATDPDEKGDQYAREIWRALAPRPIYRLKLSDTEPHDARP